SGKFISPKILEVVRPMICLTADTISYSRGGGLSSGREWRIVSAISRSSY
ncbi:hypothetical protein A2U01_0088589, partial [Trifolium medium]|nr:hypothetical protein [Trifolium medium]